MKLFMQALCGPRLTVLTRPRPSLADLAPRPLAAWLACVARCGAHWRPNGDKVDGKSIPMAPATCRYSDTSEGMAGRGPHQSSGLSSETR
jgi:hypothetical protein